MEVLFLKKSYKLIVISLSVALCLILDYIKTFIPFLNMPFGGSINIALIPVMMVSFLYGYKEGAVVGIMWWLVSSLLGLNAWFISIDQYLFDYVLPSIIPGFASLLIIRNSNKNIEIISGIIFSMLIRTFVLVFSGTYYWPEGMAKGSIAAWTYSLSYNIPYNLITCIMLCIIIPILCSRLSNSVKIIK